MKTLTHYIRKSIPGVVAFAALVLFSTFAPAAIVDATYNAATDVPITADGYTATGNTVNFTLNFAPATGTDLMVVQNTGLISIIGTFDNLTNGQSVTLSYAATNYYFVANYCGGSGNDLVLVWARNRAFAWGANTWGQLGDNTASTHPLPVPVTALGVLAGKTVLSIAAGGSHTLALSSGNSVVAWGANSYGQLGDNTTNPCNMPVAVYNAVSSRLYGKTVAAIAAGDAHSLALCSDGTLVAWGWNGYGQVGDHSTLDRKMPVAVFTGGGLSGKRVIAIAAGAEHSLALCADGTVAAWGWNRYGQLGDNTTNNSGWPVSVNTSSGVSALFGKTVVAIAAGGYWSMALCADGTVAAWGDNGAGQLGNNSTDRSLVPVAVNTTSGVSALYGEAVVAIAAGGSHGVALCADGTVAAWGANAYGQLGNDTTNSSFVPVAVNTDSGVSALFGRTVVAISAGNAHSLTLCSDGTVAAWGHNYDGELGDNSATNRLAPVLVNTTPLGAGGRFTRVLSGSYASHSLALVATPPVPEVNVTGNGLSIPNGDSSPNPAHGTDFGGCPVGGGTVMRTFTIQNTGMAPLNLTGTPKVEVTGPNAADFSVTLQPSSSVPSGGTTTLEVTFTPGATWLRTATLNIASDDGDHNPYVFSIQGTGTGALAATYTTGNEIPLTAAGLTATGSTVNFALNYGPATGTDLMVVNNTGLGFINGAFENLTNGQRVTLSYGGTNYQFVANYYGGSGNDLVLAWANNRVFAWGGNDFGQLGDSTTTNRLLPVPAIATGLLANKTLVSVVACGLHSLALCSDGTVAAWGANFGGQLGDGTQVDRYSPVAVNTGPGSALYGKTVVAIAGGVTHSLALCSDGTVAAWGYNNAGSLGDDSTTPRLVPVAVKTASGLSALYGKSVVAIAVEGYHNLALCSDGTVVAWGENNFGQLGNNTMNDSPVPVAVNTAPGVSVLYGRKVVAIAAGVFHSMALCSDGTVAAWGHNNLGQFGDGTVYPDPPNGKAAPVAVNTNSGVSALYGKQVVAIAAGGHHSLALCSDGTLAAWGLNAQGQLGDDTQTNRLVPVDVNNDLGVSALYGKTVVDIAAGGWNSVALCSDGTVTAWGWNGYGQIGDNTLTNRLTAVAVNTALLGLGERAICVSSSSSYWHNLALVAAPPHPAISVSGNGMSISNGDTTPSLADGTEFGSALVGSGIAVRTFTVQNTGSAPLSLVGTPKVTVSGPQAADFSVTLQPVSPLASGGGSTSFELTFAPSAARLRTATITIANDDTDQNPYLFNIQGTGAGELDASYTTGSEVPLTTSEFTAAGSTVNLTLNFAPAPGTDLMVVKTTGPAFINGTFDNLTNGQPVALTYGGVTFNFVANYYGGSGNDLVLVWASNRAFAWGWNNYGQLGDNTSGTNRLVPVPVTARGVLAGKTLVALAASQLHSLALCSDGTLAAWGGNGAGELGDNRASGAQSLVPVAVNTASGVSALYGKRVVAIAAGYLHSLALCSDGTVAAWGFNSYGQLGDNTTTSRPVPVVVNTAAGVSALFGKTAVAIAAGAEYSLALCADGTVAAWGYNYGGQLGDNTTMNRFVPVAVNAASGLSALFGETVVAIAAGSYQSLALCSDGTVAAWGGNDYGELGDNTTTVRHAPVAVNTASGVSALYGKRVAAIAAGYNHSLALCLDGTVAAWGRNDYGELGDNTNTNRLVPVMVNTNAGVSVLYSNTVVGIAAGYLHSLALCSDGSVAAWGWNANGQLGDNTMTNRLVPVVVNTTPLAASQRFALLSSGCYASHTLALVAAPPASHITATSAQTLANGSFQFSFTNTSGAFFGLLATTNPALPLSIWTTLGDAKEVSRGQFQFTDLQATNNAHLFYRVRSP